MAVGGLPKEFVSRDGSCDVQANGLPNPIEHIMGGVVVTSPGGISRGNGGYHRGVMGCGDGHHLGQIRSGHHH